MITREQLLAAYEKTRLELLSQQVEAGHWVGELSTSALSTATAISAIALMERHGETDGKTGCFLDESRNTMLSQLIMQGLHWLAEHQNEDGGWGDTDKSYSNIATTMLVVAAYRLTCVPAEHAGLVERAEQYINNEGDIAGLRKRYGKDKTFAVPILTNCALAGMVPWREVSALPFEAACVPQKYYRLMKLPVVSYAIPALVAIGQARFFHKKPLNPLMRMIRAAAVEPSMKVLEHMQPESGGYLEAIPLTSFVVMSLAATGRAVHAVARQGLEFLLATVRPDGSWPIDTNLATWNTTLALNALAAGGEDLEEVASLDWLLGCQYEETHPFTGAAPGGWGWSDLSGAVPDADDTPGAMLALATWHDSPSITDSYRTRILHAAEAGARWLLDLQNRNGGWPTFCRGWGKLPFDRSGADLTAHALRALHAWRDKSESDKLKIEIDSATKRGFAFLERQQRPDGSWVPLWFGNQDHPAEENPVYGTAKVLLAYRDCNRLETSLAKRGFQWLAAAQNPDGGWGGGLLENKSQQKMNQLSIVEETTLALETLLSVGNNSTFQATINKGLEWVVSAVEQNRHCESSPIGFYFAKLWYYEKLYPLIFTVAALGQAIQSWHARPTAESNTPRLTRA